MKRFIAKVAKFYKGGEKGFTLIELLIVIVILGVLAAAIIPNLSKFLGTGNVGAANAELASVRSAVAGYMTDNDGEVPAAADAATLGAYMGSSTVIKGDYTVEDDGTIITATSGDWGDKVGWDDTNYKWISVTP